MPNSTSARPSRFARRSARPGRSSTAEEIKRPRLTARPAGLFPLRRFAANVGSASAATAARAVTHELLHAFSGVDLAGIDVALAVQAHLMQPVEIAGHPPAMSEPAKLLELVAAHDVDRLVGVVADIETALLL